MNSDRYTWGNDTPGVHIERSGIGGTYYRRRLNDAGLVVECLNCGYDTGWIVRGTRDPVAALAAIVGEDADDQVIHRRVSERHQFPDILAAWCFQMIDRADIGTWRQDPASEDTESDGAEWELTPVPDDHPNGFSGVRFYDIAPEAIGWN